MDNEDLKVFIESTTNYFTEISGSKAELGIPFLLNDQKVLLDYTAVIGISGERKGGIYITATSKMIKDIITVLLGNDAPGEHLYLDMVGELANTISGNARQALGSGFMISVPMVITGSPDQIRIPGPSYGIPINWKDHKAILGIGFEK